MRITFCIITFMLLSFSLQSKADICVVETQSYDNYFKSESLNLDWNNTINTEELQCKKLKMFQDSLEVLSVTTDAGSLIAACSGIGTLVSVYLGVASLTVHTLKFAVSQLPCEESMSQLFIEKLVKENVCLELEKNNLKCQQ